jgi:hypothetical protein
MLGGFETAQGHNAQPQCGVMFGVLLQVTMFLESVRLQQWTWSRPVVLAPDGRKPLWYLRRKIAPSRAGDSTLTVTSVKIAGWIRAAPCLGQRRHIDLGLKTRYWNPETGEHNQELDSQGPASRSQDLVC